MPGKMPGASGLRRWVWMTGKTGRGMRPWPRLAQGSADLIQGLGPQRGACWTLYKAKYNTRGTIREEALGWTDRCGTGGELGLIARPYTRPGPAERSLDLIQGRRCCTIIYNTGGTIICEEALGRTDKCGTGGELGV